MHRRDRVRRAAQAVEVFDRMLEFFGEDGAHWLQGEMDDAEGRRCLYGALEYLCPAPRVLRNAVEEFLAVGYAPNHPLRQALLILYNDRADSFDDVRLLILAARELAVAEIDRQPPQKLAA
jgi:hypothetical protein